MDNPIKQNTPPNQSASDRLAKKDSRKLTWFVVGLIAITTLLLLCILPGSPALGVFLKLPEKAQSVVTKIEPIAFDPVGPSAGGPANVEFPVGSSIIVDVPPDLTRPRPTPTPPRRWPDCVRPVTGITIEFTEIEECPTSSIPKPPTAPPVPVPGDPKDPKIFDLGDAPDKPRGGFPSLLSSNGARHIDVSRFYLGKRVDVEADSKQVDADSATPPNGVGPDDGLNLVLNQVVGAAGTAIVDGIVEIHNNNWPENKPIYLNALYDFNNNLRWDIPGEHIVIDQELNIPPGESAYGNILSLSANRLNWLRATVTDIPLGASYNGAWPKAFNFGETEDYFKPELYPIHIVAGSHFVFTSEGRYHRPGNSEIHLTGITYGVPTEPGPLKFVPVVPGEKPAPAKPAPGEPTPTPGGGTTRPEFDPNRKYPIKGIPTVILYDPATGVYRHHDGVDSRFGEAVDDDFLKTHGIPLVPRSIFSITLPPHGATVIPVPTITLQRFSQLIGVDLSDLLGGQGVQLSVRYHSNFVKAFTQLNARTGVRTIFQRIVETVFQPSPATPAAPVPTTPPTSGVATQYKIEVLSVNTSTGTTKIRATGFLDGNNEVVLTAYSKSGTKLDVRSVPFDVASIIFDYVAPSGAVSIQAQLVHNGNPVPGVIAAFPSVAVITGSGGGGGPVVAACAAAPNITTTSLPDGRTGTAYSQTIAVTGGVAPLTFSISAGSLPTGLSINSSSGVISGTPTVVALSSFTVQVADACSNGAQTDTQALTIDVPL